MTNYMQDGIEKGLIPVSVFNRNLNINLDGQSWSIKPLAISVKGLVGIAGNLNNIMLGTCFIAIDEAFNTVFGPKPRSLENDLNSLRAIIFMIRCAFAHNPTTPTWEIKKLKYQRVLSVKEIGYTLDFTSLNGKIFRENRCDLNRLIKHCLTLLQKVESA
jgi:hypothetical protein